PATGMPYCLPIPIPAEGADASVGLFYAPPGPHRIDVSGRESGKYDFLYMPMDGMLMTFDVETSAGSRDNITLRPRELSTTFSTPDSKKFGYRMVREFKDRRVARMFILDNIRTHSGSLTFSTTPEGDVLLVRNEGEATSYDLRIEYLAENGEPQSFEWKDLPLGGNETQRIFPSSWESLNTQVKMEVDKGSDGSWEESVELSPGRPSAGGRVTWVVVVGILAGALIVGILVLLRRFRGGR
ncbi:MAG: hypothetical protein QW084_04290, partial [Candidatus Hadarchaeales archaeon]